MKSSKISGFYKMNIDERISLVKEFAGLTYEESALLKNTGSLNRETANRMIENVIGIMPITLGIAVNFQINGTDYLIPMAIEEASVVAAASFAAKIARDGGGFEASATEPVMIGQVQITNIPNPKEAEKRILEKKKEIIDKLNEKDPALLVKYGGGVRDIKTNILKTERGTMLIVQLLVDVRDAMGANAINTISEKVAKELEEITGGKVRLRIISNLAIHRLSKARARFPKEIIGEDAVEGILDAYEFAAHDAFRCATHNKGIMNGVSAVALATGNDFRAMEAGAHSYATYKGKGKYSPLTKYWKDEKGDLWGEIEIPTAIGIIGGITKAHPIAKINLKILGVKTAQELGMVMASVGLAQNFAALRALATEGIQRGHMNLHAKNIAMTAGAKGDEVDKVAQKLIEEKNIRMDRAKEIIEELRK